MRVYTPGERLALSTAYNHAIHNGAYCAAVNAQQGLYTIVGEDYTTGSVINLTKAPHLLIAGATGSGKSVLEHSIICSLMIGYTFASLRFVMIDPKRVELSQYKKSPFLKMPIVTDCEKAGSTLETICKEMDTRYKRMERKGWRDYNTNLGERIVIVIDEYADLILQYKKQVEKPLIRIAQLGRACGIHLIICTQRPDSHVITGTLKANIPTRIALRTASAIDSRIIIDQTGAEQLRGKGDCIVRTDEGLTRCQVPYIQDQDIEAINEWYKRKQWKKHGLR